jgi:hypothetical protein
MLASGAPLAAVAGHLGDTIATVMTTCAHWLPDDRNMSAEALDRALRLDRPQITTGGSCSLGGAPYCAPRCPSVQPTLHRSS